MANENEDGGLTVDDETVVAPAVETPAVEGVEPSLLDVVSAAIDGTGPRAITPKQDEIDQDDTRPRNADGTFKTETDEEKTTREAAEAAAKLAKETPEEKAARIAAETPEEKAAREAAEAAAKKEPDAVNDPIPEGLNKRTAERMKSLITTVKEQETLIASHTGLFDIVRDSGTPEEFSSMIGYMRASKSNDPKTLDTAYQMLQSELRGLAVRMGKPLYEVNLLRDPENKDLLDEIAAGTLTNPRAHELALQRESLKQRQGQKKREETEGNADQEHQTGMADLDALEKALVKRDGVAVYRAKRDILESTLQATMESVSPLKWKAIFTKAYDGMKTPVTAAAPKPAAVVPAIEKQQPLRTKQPSGASGASAEPKSALEAMNMALGS